MCSTTETSLFFFLGLTLLDNFQLLDNFHRNNCIPLPEFNYQIKFRILCYSIDPSKIGAIKFTDLIVDLAVL